MEQPTKKQMIVAPRKNFPGWLVVEDILSSSELEEFMAMLDIDSQKPKESHVYNRVTKTNLVNKHLRSSRKIEYRDDALFDWLETHLVNPLNDTYNDFKFYLVRNDVEVVQYSEGDFFKKHQDYINFDSNEFKNYTFLLCLGACQEGGETLIYESHSEDHHVIECTARSMYLEIVLEILSQHCSRRSRSSATML
jgi:hypothetical protein